MNYVYAYEKTCSSCKYFIPHLGKKPELGVCRFFKNKPYENSNRIVYDYAVHCRNDAKLCGSEANFYVKIDDVKIDDVNNDDSTTFVEAYENLNNSCCGEVNEKNEIDELEKLEKEFFEVYQKIKKHNTQRIYNTAKDLYKLFKKNK
jgi:NifU-like protein involved in Fe-S cluster formation